MILLKPSFWKEKKSMSNQPQLFTDDPTPNWLQKLCRDLNVDMATSGWPDRLAIAMQTQVVCKGPKTLSLFSGAGGLDIGFHDAGFDIIEANELEPAFAKTLEKNASDGGYISGTNVVCLDIRKYDPAFSNLDFIIGGPPCQTFSAAGARAAGVRGTNDDRGTLFAEYVRILKKLKPKGFLFENVYRIIGANRGKDWEKIVNAFSDVGYNLSYRILDTADFGVPQFRERLIIVGTRCDLGIKYRFPRPTHGPDAYGRQEYYSASLATGNVSVKGAGKPLSGRHGHLLNDIPPGLNYSFYTEKLGHPNPIFGWRSKFSDYLYKADPSEPVRTIKAQGGQYTGPFHWDSRPFSVDELKRLQTFPDAYEIVGGRGKAIHQIGNSVPPQFARILALSIIDQLFPADFSTQIDYLEPGEKLSFRARKSARTKKYAQIATEATKHLVQRTDNSIDSEYELVAGLDRYELRPDAQDARFQIKYTNERACWKYRVYEDETGGVPLWVVKLSLSAKSRLPREIFLEGYSASLDSLMCLWKALERDLNRWGIKDDITQLLGYYTWSEKVEISTELMSDHTRTPVWRLLKLITENILVGKVFETSVAADLLQIDDVEVIDCLRQLKTIGFEIRSKNTNPQMSRDEYLVPYPAPTLNNRSLQGNVAL